MLGVLAAAALLALTVVVVGGGVVTDRGTVTGLTLAHHRVLAGWVLLTSSLLVLVAVLVVAYPEFVGLGG